MQNLIVGKSGSGKGYEICAFHILTALQQGRKVITNMPLVLEKWAALDPTFPALIEMRKRAMPIRGTWEPTREEGAFHLFDDPSAVIKPPPTARVFAGVWDFYTTWKHPETGAGPLFIIDEAQNVIPRARTAVEVEEWSALHRHYNCDVLFATQSYGKLSQAVRDNIQILYRLTKKTAWGQPDRYIRKVQEGIRGEVLNTTERTYNPGYFGLWVSHTQGGAGQEYGANDIVPYWKHWTFKGAAICMLFAFSICLWAIFGSGSDVPSEVVTESDNTRTTTVQHPTPKPPPKPPIEAKPRGDDGKMHPYAGNTMHLSALVRGTKNIDGEDVQYLGGFITIAQGGQPVSRLDFDDLRLAGYTITYLSNRVVSLTFKGYDIGYVVDDLPRVGLKPQGVTASIN